jgi:phage head maturation protease
VAETSPGDARATERLHAYWVHGEGAAKIRWGEPDDFARCTAELGKYIKDPEGYCNLAHHEATGMWPAEHAAMEKKTTGRSAVTATQRADAKAPYGDVPYADPGYLDADGNQASKSGKPGVKRYPLDAEHVEAAWSYINQDKNAGQYTPDQLASIKSKTKAAMSKHGHDVADQPAASRTESVFFRTYELEDIRVVKRAEGDGSGRLVEAYAAVFNVPAEIRDHEGHYNEENDPAAFNRSIDHAARASRSPFRCIYNHGMTIHGTPAERFSIPIGTPEEVRAETRGLLTRTRYNETPLADEVLEAIISGGITAQSYSGRIIRSTPPLRPGEKYRPRGGQLQTVRRLELGLREYGPTPFPAFSGAEILGVRMSTPGSWSPDPDEEQDPGTAPDDAPAAGDPLSRTEDGEHSARYHQHELYRMTSEKRRRQVGLDW